MSSMAKAAREAMKAKAKNLTSSGGDPTTKVDSSTWTPAEPLNTEAKTGLRPVSRRAFKIGGKVTGVKANANMGKKARASGGSAKSMIDAKINRNVKDANAERPGVKHVGGMKKGGRAKKEDGGWLSKGIDRLKNNLGLGSTPKPSPFTNDESKEYYAALRENRPSEMDRKKLADMSAAATDTRSNQEAQRKSGGRTKKAYGGPMAGAAKMISDSVQQAGVPSATMTFGGLKKGSVSPARGLGLKKGGVAHDDVKADKALIKKMVKPSARTGKAGGGGMPKAADMDDVERGLARNQLARSMAEDKLREAGKNRLSDISENMGYATHTEPHDFPKLIYPGAGLKKGGRAKRATGGGVFSGPGYPGKVPGAVGGRTAHADGGKAGKGKTDINIVIAAGKPAGAGDMMPGGPTPPPKPVSVPPPAMPPAGMPMPSGGMPPMPPQGGAGGPPMGGMPPMPRKAGGRTYRSYKDMDAGAGSGEGRLEKTEIAKRAMHNKGGKVGHRSYNSYKDMDAGAGSGFGRLEKTEMARKKSGIQKA